ncbi:DMT family transporter [Methanolobus profundi]|uniref:EamA-like transporter family protein n=1 Tax=Methanolobus profundi TaxID=487685 RepID=A0A1I4TKS8_9EURY|nr:DMT family transporter [Methanolobus profundi]SFM77233.1 EamA-like transporter family protein [Methanolobus profundi]
MEPSIIMYGLAAALCWGAADFSGGFATKRNKVLIVAIVSQTIGLILLTASAITFSESIPPTTDILWGASAGLAGGMGLLALYYALSIEKMGVVAPVTAVISALVPMSFGMITEGLPPTSKLIGFLFAFIGVWLISRDEDSPKIELQKLKLPFLAGTGFGTFMILIDQVQAEGIYWPLVGARVASISAFIIAAWYMKQLKISGIRYFPLILLAGVLDTGGNVFYVLAAKAGRLDIAAILTSLYPAITILLAWALMKERLKSRQWAGVISVMLAVILIS